MDRSVRSCLELPHFPRTARVVALVLSAGALACSLPRLGGGSPVDYAAMLGAPANPLQITPELDSARASSAAIAAAGGAVEATAADGTRYTLSIPEGALTLEQEITLTPVREIADVPLDSLAGAAVIGPAGLHFYEIATLTIEPAEEIPLAEQVTFGFGARDGEFHLQPLALEADAIQILVLESGGLGAARADRAALLEYLPTSPGDRFVHHLADALLRGRGQGSNADIGAEVDALFAASYAALVERLEAAPEPTQARSAARGELQLASASLRSDLRLPPPQTALSCDEAHQLLDQGLYEKYLVELGVTEGEGFESPADTLIIKVAEACLLEAHEECVADHNLARLPEEYLAMWYLGELGLASDRAEAEIERLALGLMERCYRFDLEVISIVEVKEEGIGGFESIMTSRVPLRLQQVADLATAIVLSELEVAGAAPLVNESMTWEVAPGGCSITGVTGGTDIDVLGLPLILSGQGLGEVNLTYRTGESSEGGTVQCPQASTADVPTGGYWSNSYLALHIDEMSMTPEPGAVPDLSSGGLPPFVARGWELLGGEDVARKEYVRSQDQLSEDTTFLLIHTPQ